MRAKGGEWLAAYTSKRQKALRHGLQESAATDGFDLLNQAELSVQAKSAILQQISTQHRLAGEDAAKAPKYDDMYRLLKDLARSYALSDAEVAEKKKKESQAWFTQPGYPAPPKGKPKGKGKGKHQAGKDVARDAAGTPVCWKHAAEEGSCPYKEKCRFSHEPAVAGLARKDPH